MNSNELQKEFKSRRVFFLGAGFSYDAGIPLTKDLLKLSMHNFSLDSEGIYKRVINIIKTCFSIENNIDFSVLSFSNLCTFLEYKELREYAGGERFSENGSREKLALKYFLSKTIAQNTPENEFIPEIYLEFAKQLKDKDLILTFNWDCLLEMAIEKVGKKFTYHYNGEGIKIFKMHGSINWRLGEPNDLGQPIKDNFLNWESMKLSDNLMPKEIYFSEKLFNHHVWKYYNCLGEVEPFIILPGYGKAFDVRNLAHFWYKSEYVFAFTHDVYIIGLSLAPDDFFIRSFFLDNLPHLNSFTGFDDRKLFIINPSETEKDNYDFILNKDYTVFFNENFSMKHIELMNKRRI